MPADLLKIYKVKNPETVKQKLGSKNYPEKNLLIWGFQHLSLKGILCHTNASFLLCTILSEFEKKSNNLQILLKFVFGLSSVTIPKSN